MWLIDFLFRRKRQIQRTADYEAYLNSLAKKIERYKQIKQSEELVHFLKLREEVTSEEFLRKKASIDPIKYEQTDEYKKVRRIRSLRWKFSVWRYRRLEKTTPVTENLQKQMEQMCANNPYVAEYARLKKETQTVEFAKFNEFWKNPKRWYTTEEGKREELYNAEKRKPNIAFFLKEETPQVKEYSEYEPVFQDDFEWTQLEQSSWQSGFIHPGKKYIHHHTYANEQQAYAKGNNVSTQGSILSINTKKEDATMLAWHDKFGFLEKKFEYVSDVIQTAESFQIGYGVIQVKARVTGHVNHCICLKNEEKQPNVLIMQTHGSKIHVGLLTDKEQNTQVLPDFIKSSEFFIYTLVRTKTDLTWYVNDVKVFQKSFDLPVDKLFIQMYSFAPVGSEISTGSLQVDWIRAYAKTK